MPVPSAVKKQARLSFPLGDAPDASAELKFISDLGRSLLFTVHPKKVASRVSSAIQQSVDAVVHTRNGSRERAIPIGELHTLPGDHPEVENVLEQGELITHVELPPSPFAAHARYVKVRDRAAFAFALAAAAVGLDVADGRIRGARVALGGVATKPWRSLEAEQALVGQAPGRPAFERAAAAAIADPRPRRDNAFKVGLAKRTIVRALELAWGAP